MSFRFWRLWTVQVFLGGWKNKYSIFFSRRSGRGHHHQHQLYKVAGPPNGRFPHFPPSFPQNKPKLFNTPCGNPLPPHPLWKPAPISRHFPQFISRPFSQISQCFHPLIHKKSLYASRTSFIFCSPKITAPPITKNTTLNVPADSAACGVSSVSGPFITA